MHAFTIDVSAHVCLHQLWLISDAASDLGDLKRSVREVTRTVRATFEVHVFPCCKSESYAASLTLDKGPTEAREALSFSNSWEQAASMKTRSLILWDLKRNPLKSFANSSNDLAPNQVCQCPRKSCGV